MVISVDKEKLQVGCSIKQLSPDPFEHISNYELNKPYKVKIIKLMDFGAFAELEPGLSTLLHSSELSWTKKNPSTKKMLKVGDEIECVITEIDKEKRRVAISHRLTKENPYEAMEKKYPVGSEVHGVGNTISEYALYIRIDDLEIDAFCHCNDLTYGKDSEAELKKYKKGDKLKVKVLEIRKDQQKIRVGLRQIKPDPVDWFKDKKVNDAVTVQVVSSDNKGLVVKPEGCELNFVIKKSQIAINSADARPSRFVGSERIDAAIAELDKSKRKVYLSIKLLEELKNKEAVSKFSSPLSGKNLPFSSLSDKLEKKKEKKKTKLAIVKSKLLKQLSDNYPNFLKKDLEKSLNIVLNEIKLALLKGENVELRDFGTWSLNTQKARLSRNPKSGEKIETPEKKKIRFKMSKKLFKKINNNE